MTEPTEQQLKAASAVFCENGFDISMPWECTQDDLERHWFETLKKAISAALAAPAASTPSRSLPE